MAQPALASFTTRGVVLKNQPTPGLDSVPTAIANGLQLFDGTSGTEYDKVVRNKDSSFFGGKPFVVTNRRAFIEGGFELTPPAAPGNAGVTGDSNVDIMLKIAGMTAVKTALAKTTKYNPISSAIPIASAYYWHVDLKTKILDARANISALRIAIGERISGRVRIQGPFTGVETEVLPAITYPVVIPIVADADNMAVNLNVNGGADILVWSKDLELDFANAIGTKVYSSHKETGISGREPTWSLRIAKTAMADFDPWALQASHAVITGRARVSDASPGLASELGFRGQIETVAEVDIEGDLGFQISGPCIPSDAGGDEFYILFIDTTP